MRRAPWECFDNAAGGIDPGETNVPGREVVSSPELPRSPGRRRELAYEARKRALATAWLTPSPLPSMPTPSSPATWMRPIADPVTVVTEPAASNPSKGAGIPLAEVERVRAEQRAAFKERLQQQWLWNVSHL